ncbi:hypothetical protein HK096_010403, partial [Nowakowskiella sp. JEL0078]
RKILTTIGTQTLAWTDISTQTSDPNLCSNTSYQILIHKQNNKNHLLPLEAVDTFSLENFSEIISEDIEEHEENLVVHEEEIIEDPITDFIAHNSQHTYNEFENNTHPVFEENMNEIYDADYNYEYTNEKTSQQYIPPDTYIPPTFAPNAPSESDEASTTSSIAAIMAKMQKAKRELSSNHLERKKKRLEMSAKIAETLLKQRLESERMSRKLHEEAQRIEAILDRVLVSVPDFSDNRNNHVSEYQCLPQEAFENFETHFQQTHHHPQETFLGNSIDSHVPISYDRYSQQSVSEINEDIVKNEFFNVEVPIAEAIDENSSFNSASETGMDIREDIVDDISSFHAALETGMDMDICKDIVDDISSLIETPQADVEILEDIPFEDVDKIQLADNHGKEYIKKTAVDLLEKNENPKATKMERTDLIPDFAYYANDEFESIENLDVDNYQQDSSEISILDDDDKAALQRIEMLKEEILQKRIQAEELLLQKKKRSEIRRQKIVDAESRLKAELM